MLVEVLKRDLVANFATEPHLSVLLLAGLAPVGGSELEDAATTPGGQDAQQVSARWTKVSAPNFASSTERRLSFLLARQRSECRSEPTKARRTSEHSSRS